MRTQFSNYSMDKFNNELNQMLDDKLVNFFKLFVMTEPDTKLSVTLLPMDIYNNRYHGLHPKFDEAYLRKFLSNNEVNESDKFWSSIYELQTSEPYGLFDLIYDDCIEEEFKELGDIEELKTILLGRSILQMGSRYGFKVKFVDSMTKNSFSKELDLVCNSLELDKRILLETYDEGYESFAKFKGIWPIELITIIQSKYDFVEKDNNLLLIPSEEGSKQKLLTKTLSFQQMKYFVFIPGGVYYSGVMPRVMNIDYKCNQASNSTIKHLSFGVCRTTFATVDMMDNSEILNHFFFNGRREDHDRKIRMDAFDYHEDNVQMKYLYKYNDSLQNDQKAYELNEISKLNTYLKYSFNTHTIAVSCNIKTSDNFLIAAQRDEISIDAGEFYCSANGQSEFMDKHVSFYKESVFEDLPSMNYNSDYRVDLNNEIRREVIAELGITALNSEWNYLGVSYLAINQEKNKNDQGKPSKRRMHFNVLTSNKTSLDFKSVVANQKHATENFENSKVVGIQTILFGTLSELILKTIKFIYKWINENKSRMFLLLFFLSVVVSKNRSSDLNMQNIVDISLLMVYFLLSTYEYFKNRKLRKLKFVKRFYLPHYMRKQDFNAIKLFNKLSKIRYTSKRLTFHGIFIIMYMLTLIHEE